MSERQDADLDVVFARISPAAFAATTSDVVVAARLAVKHGIKNLIVFDHDERDEADCAAVEDARRTLAEAGDHVTLTLPDRLVETGRQMDWTFLPPHPDGEGRGCRRVATATRKTRPMNRQTGGEVRQAA